MINVDMLEDCVLVEQIESENDASAGGIILPDKINERPIMAKVLAVGPGVKLETGNRFPMTLHQGDTVAFPRKSGDHFLIDGRALIVIPERYVLMRIIPENHSAALIDTPENRAKMENINDGDIVMIDGEGNIVMKEEK